MKISARTEYAWVAMLELAANYGLDEPVPIRVIAERHGVPARFLVQILLQLKAAGLVASTRGAAGGYRLARPPAEVSLGQVMDVIGGSTSATRVPSASPESPAVKVLMRAWQDVADEVGEMLAENHLRYLVQEYVRYYHTARPHQSLGNLPPEMDKPPDDAGVLGPDDVECHELARRVAGALRAQGGVEFAPSPWLTQDARPPVGRMFSATTNRLSSTPAATGRWHFEFPDGKTGSRCRSRCCIWGNDDCGPGTEPLMEHEF